MSAEAPVRTTCAVCGGDRRVTGFHLTHGVVVQLCQPHRNLRYLSRRGGRDLTEHLERVWRAHGMANATRMRALAAHRRRYGSRPPVGHRPGSYSWPALRQEAERRFAAAEPPDVVIVDLRQRHIDDVASAPSVQTMRRWFREARWVDDADSVRARSDGRSPLGSTRSDRGGAGTRTGRYRFAGKPTWIRRYESVYGMHVDLLVPWMRMLTPAIRSRPDDDLRAGWTRGP